MKLPSLKALQTFEAASRHGSFTKAADELGVTQGAVSAQIANLEDALGVKLFIRSTRQVHLSDRGRGLARACRRAFDGIAEEVALIRAGSSEKVLTISVSTFVTTKWLSRRLSSFLERYPDIAVRFHHSVNEPDFSAENVDLTIRWGRQDDEALGGELWLETSKRAMCSPQLCKGPVPLEALADLRSHTLLRDVPRIDLWDRWFELAGLELTPDQPSNVLKDPVVRVQAAVDGLGVVLADDLALDDIAAGRLVEPFDIEVTGYGYHLIPARQPDERPALRKFRAWLHSEISGLG
ncbi:transcriptional regulator GcvA [Paralimibaculum aggregatum]|uniref:Transcriptional regulator GcvA n=1 Tax=Paralimibaculum aggregatum TaxID=3036245 RepID=A0ABQ6LMY0_9RHOB|nr:LysR substrate-binding domain-containing protein [Limibaculum sp. NKW23]GMG84557.1 transcriptional regulator GcvA [Limibaculum sp. NKW23]